MNTDKTDKQIETLTISRKRWLTAKDVNEDKALFSMLYRPKDRKMCCLGFLGRACGAKVSELANKGSPSDVKQVNWPAGMLKEIEGYGGGTRIDDSDFSFEMMKANDSNELTQRQREKEIRRLFKEHLNIAVKFVP